MAVTFDLVATCHGRTLRGLCSLIRICRQASSAPICRFGICNVLPEDLIVSQLTQLQTAASIIAHRAAADPALANPQDAVRLNRLINLLWVADTGQLSQSYSAIMCLFLRTANAVQRRCCREAYQREVLLVASDPDFLFSPNACSFQIFASWVPIWTTCIRQETHRDERAGQYCWSSPFRYFWLFTTAARFLAEQFCVSGQQV